MPRLFVGLPLPEPVRDRLAMLGAGIPGARWVAAENLHLTLRFVGEVDFGVMEDLAEALDGIAAPGFDLTLAGLGHFETKGAAHSLWVGAERAPALMHLQARVEAAARRAGLPPEGRRFLPHVTLARLRGAPPDRVSAFIAGNNLFRAGPIPVASFTLFSSHLAREGAIYREEASFPLGPPDRASVSAAAGGAPG